MSEVGAEFARAAPRLRAAYLQERQYQEKKQQYNQRGELSFEIAAEEMVRILRKQNQAFRTLGKELRKLRLLNRTIRGGNDGP